MSRLSIAITLASFALLSAVLPSVAEAGERSPLIGKSGVSSQPGVVGTAELEVFLDGFFADEMAEKHVPGAAFVMVQDGQISLMKGYGYADIESGTPVDPKTTVFRAGSVSKLVTCTAVMQQVEQGTLSLNTDVNDYLSDFSIPSNYPTPITLDHLMTHTAGFEDRWIGYETHNESKTLPLGEFVQSNIPARVSEPGTVHSYSNYGIDLAGYLVEQAAGISFPEYVERNIFRPLGMIHTTFEQSLPSAMASELAVGYSYTGDTYSAAPFSYVNTMPSSGMSTTAADMAAFMIAHLQDGQYGSESILNEATARIMHQQQFTHDPALPGMAYGFKERYINGWRVIGHGGDLHNFASQMILIPERNEGFFVVYNSFSDAFREDLISAIFDRYYPAQQDEASSPTITLSQEDLSRFTGRYRWVKYPRTTIGKLIALPPGPYNVTVKSNSDGGLSMSFFGSSAEWHYAPVAPLVFTQTSGGAQQIGNLEVDPGNTLVFREGKNADIAYGFVPLQNTAFERLSWYEFPEIMLGMLGILVILFISPFLVWPIGILVRRITRRGSPSRPSSNKALLLAGIVCGLNALFCVGLFLTFGEKLVFGTPTIVVALLAIPIVTSVLTLVMLATNILAWKNSYWSIAGRAYYTLITLSAVVFIAWAAYWNLIGFRF